MCLPSALMWCVSECGQWLFSISVVNIVYFQDYFCMSILFLRMTIWDLSNVLCVAKLVVTSPIWGSMLRISIFLAWFHTTASIVVTHSPHVIIWTTISLCIIPKRCFKWNIRLTQYRNFISLSIISGESFSFYQYIEKDPDNGPKSHKCTVCGKTSNDRGNLRKHVESIHFKNSFVYNCAVCGKSFNAKNNLYVHMSNEHRS